MDTSDLHRKRDRDSAAAGVDRVIFLVMMMIAGLLLASCNAGAPPREAGFDSPLPADRARALGAAPADAPLDGALALRLIEQLDHPDALVRFAAMEELRRRSGETHGYSHDAPPPRRRAAVERWVAWYNERFGE